MVDNKILELSLESISKAFDEFVGSCVDNNGYPIAPPTSALMKAKGCLPPYCKHSFKKKVKSNGK